MGHTASLLLLAVFAGQAASPNAQAGSEVAGSGRQGAAESETSAAAEKTAAREEAARRLDVLKRTAAAYDLRVGPDGDTKLTLRREPLLHWTNPVRISLDGAMFIWTANGRPQVAACIYSSTHRRSFSALDHEFQSLSTGPLTARRHGKPVWLPAEAGITLKPFPGAPAPAKTPVLRLVQMRRLASQFTAVCYEYDVRKKDHWRLRLIPQPLHRYGGDEDALIDGALFVFVQATDPEVIVLLEARADDTEPKWHYGLARMCGLPLEVRFGERVIWEAPLYPVTKAPDPRKPYITFYDNPIE